MCRTSASASAGTVRIRLVAGSTRGLWSGAVDEWLDMPAFPPYQLPLFPDAAVPSVLEQLGQWMVGEAPWPAEAGPEPGT